MLWRLCSDGNWELGEYNNGESMATLRRDYGGNLCVVKIETVA